MAEERCKDTELLASQCGCKKHRPEPKEERHITSVFLANWPGQCGDCGAEFIDGDQVGFDNNDVLVCNECVDRIGA